MSSNTYLCSSQANVFFERYDTRSFTFTIRNADWTPVNITGWVLKLRVDEEEAPTDPATQVFELDGVLTNPGAGVVSFTPTQDQASLVAGTYYYKLDALLPSPTVATLVRGHWVVFDGLCEQAPATEVDICNLALSFIGDTAKVLSIQPPDTSTQARLCAQMYPMALTATLEMHHWAFATRRAELALVDMTPIEEHVGHEHEHVWGTNCDCSEWDYFYVLPNKFLRPIAVLPMGSTDDYTGSSDFTIQKDSLGTVRLYTDVKDAVLLYTEYIDEPQLFPPNFRIVLAWHLASMLAGPLIKGDVGAAESKRCLQMMQMYLAKSSSTDSHHRRVHPTQNPNWISSR